MSDLCASAADTIDDEEALHGSTHNGPRNEQLPEATVGTRKYGRFHIVNELGRGGMGIVYRAYDSVQQRYVALKTLPQVEPSTLARFKHEFRALAQVNHPNVIRLYELVSDEGSWFFAMELVEDIDFLQ